MNIIKRDGREVPYDLNRIVKAIEKAMAATGEQGIAALIASEVAREVHEGMTVEEIQDIVERELMQSGFFKTAKAYCVYRDLRNRAREAKTKLMKSVDEIIHVDAINSDSKRENANTNTDAPMGAMLQIGSACARTYNDLYLLHPEHSKAHREGDFHIHKKLWLCSVSCIEKLGEPLKDGCRAHRTANRGRLLELILC